MVVTMLRATSRKAFGSIVSRKFTFNNRNDKSDSNCNNSNGTSSSSSSSSTGHDNESGSQASGKRSSTQCRLEGFIDLQRMFFHSIGIFGSLILIGHKFHSDCIRFKPFSPSACAYVSSSAIVATDDHHHHQGCSFIDSLTKTLPHLASSLNPSFYQQSLNVLPFHVLPVSPSSSSSALSFDSDKDNHDEESSIKDVNVIERIVDGMRSELDVFTDELKNIQANVLMQRNQMDKAINLLKSCPKSAKAMFNLGIVYESGQHDPINGQPNYTNALKYYTNAASLGHRLAHYNLALIYLYGKQPIAMDKAKGMSLLHRAAELGVPEAQQFVEREQLMYSQLREIRIRHSQELVNQLNTKTIDSQKLQPDTNNNIHTSRSSPNFFASIMSYYLEPSLKDESIMKSVNTLDSESTDPELLHMNEDETIHEPEDSLEIVFMK